MSLAERLLARPLKTLEPYQSARRIGGHGQVYLNANESARPPPNMPAGETWQRYPDFLPAELSAAYAAYAGVASDQVVAVRGADEAIDLLIRTFCEPRQDAVRIQAPTYSMYEFVAEAHGVAIDSVALDENFDLNTSANTQLEAADGALKLVFICHPNNPTGNQISRDRIITTLLAQRDNALVVVDEAYIEYCPAAGLQDLLDEHPNLVIIRTLSKAFALAAVRVGFVLAQPDVLEALCRLMPPYPMPDPCARIAMAALTADGVTAMQQRRDETNVLRETTRGSLEALACVETVYDSDTNFLLAEFRRADVIMDRLLSLGIVLRDQTHHPLLPRHLRMTIGNAQEMQQLLRALRELN